MTAPKPKLPMKVFLRALKKYGMDTHARLVADGFPSKLVIYKAVSLSGKGYCDYGTTPKYCWLTPKGEAYLATKEDRENSVTLMPRDERNQQ